MNTRSISILIFGGIFLNLIFANCGTDAKEQVKTPMQSKDLLKKNKQSSSNTVPKEYIVKLNAGTDSKRIAELLPNHKIVKIDKISDDTYHVVYETEPGLEALVQAGKKSGFVEYAEPNHVYKAF